MATITQHLVKRYNHVLHDLADPRTKDWFLVESPGPLLTILATYLFFCIYAGPQYMKDRKPFKLKYTIMIYNLFQVGLSVFMTYRGIEYVYKTNYRFQCQNIDFSESGTRWAAGIWWYYIAKLTELLDTVFFVLRKKNNQVSFLHLYHHTVMPLISYYGIKYIGGGQGVPEGSLNSFIHILMYSYYFLAGLGPQYQKYLWWKKYLTKMQLVQFCIVLYLNVTAFLSPTCNYPKGLNLFVSVNCIAFLYMFGMFYYKSYVNSNKNKTENKEIVDKEKDI